MRGSAPPAAPAIPRSHDPGISLIKVEARRVIRAPVQKVFQLVSRLEAQPRVTGLWLSADLLDRRPTQLTVHYRGYFAGVPLESVQRATLVPPHRVEFRQTRGGLRSLRGEYSLQPVDGETELTVTLEADIGIPLIADATARRVLGGYAERMLDKFKLTAERDLPRVVRRPREEQAPSPEAGIPVAPADHAGIEEEDRAAAPAVAAELPAESGQGTSDQELRTREEGTGAAAPVTSTPGTGRRRRRRRRRRRQSSQSSQSTQPTQRHRDGQTGKTGETG